VTAPAAVRVDLGDRSYDVLVGPGAGDAAVAACAEAVGTGRVALLADGNVRGTHGRELAARLTARGIPVTVFALPPGERAKTLETVEEAARHLVGEGFERGDLVVALGGGAATDVAGFVAAVLLRGVRWASFPTTLLSQVDAAIGGKTGVNLPEGKNLVGAFHQPLVVACDPAVLATLPAREYRSGLAEVVKTAWIGDPRLFGQLEDDPPLGPEHPSLPGVVRRCVAVKAEVVAADERETGRRAVLNFGHTIGHAIETERGGRLLHGEAVALGLVAALHLSVRSGRCAPELLDRLIRLLERLGLPVRDPALDVARVLARTQRDKKRSGGRDRYQLTTGIGFVSVADDLPDGAPRAAIEFLRR
jgi:3-dehydroquinate synthase